MNHTTGFFKGFMDISHFNFLATNVVYGVIVFLESWTHTKYSWVEHFGKPYSTLSLNGLDELQRGMQFSITFQRATKRRGSLTMTGNGFIHSTIGKINYYSTKKVTNQIV